MHVDLKKNTPMKSMLKAGHTSVNVDEIIKNATPQRHSSLPSSRGNQKDLTIAVE